MLRWLWGIALISLLACGSSKEETPQSSETKADEELLAKVHDKELRLSDLPTVSAAAQNSDDSLKMIRTAVDRWVKDQLFLEEAASNIPSDLDIEKLVYEYRQSLLQHYFEEKLIKTQLDTVISDFDMKEHFEANKDLYKLENSILRCIYIKVRKPVRKSEKLEKWIEKKDLDQLNKYCMNNAEFCLINTDKWHQWDVIKEVLPKKFQNLKLKTGLKNSFADFSHQYYFHVLEYVSKKNDAPFSYIEERATKLIIRERKNRLLEELKQRLFTEQKDSRHVQIYVE